MKEQILSHITAACPFRDTLHWYSTVDSTNTLGKQLAQQGAPHGTVLIAGQQTGGRGRMGRSFHSPQGHGIYYSLILRPDCKAEELMHLTCAVGTAVCDAVEAVTGRRPGVKWINDLVLGKKKLGGILTELSVAPSGDVAYAVVGIGINCTHSGTDFPPELETVATSLSMEGLCADKAKLCAAMTEALYKLSRELLPQKHAIMERYRKDCITVGQDIAVLRSEETRYGRAVSVESDGSLLVEYADGTREAVSSGEVSVRGMYGYV
ncbi:MAG: biotin--[Oscillospiraceae bacterium]|nr:biotin--[acetyl-CoA-carboxylase] ligase [Oscillospiraceae bacterium]